MNKYLKIDSLNFSYSSKDILQDINIEFEKGKFYSIIGPNGCGKTTLLKNISKLLTQHKGSIYIDNKDIKNIKSKSLSQKLAVVPQAIHIDYEFKVYDIVMMGRVPYKGRMELYNEDDSTIVKKCMELTNTWILKDKLITELSGGESQRVIAARALAQETEIILLDEPTSHLDLQYQIEFFKIFKNISKDKVVIAVLHDLNLVSAFSDEIIMLKDSKVFAVGSAKDILTKQNIKAVYNIDVDIIELEEKIYILPII